METNPTKTLRDVIGDFEKLAPLQRDYSPRTMRSYLQWLHKYAQWAGPDAPFDDFNPDRLRDFKNAVLLDGGYRPRSRAAMNTALRTFDGWLVEEGLRNTSVTAVLGKVKLDDVTRRVVSEAETRALFGACERIYIPRRRALARALLAVLSYAGLRRSELLALHLDDFQTDVMRPGSYKIFVRMGKGGRSRDVPICDDAAQAVRDWIPFRLKSDLPNLFIQSPRGPLSKGGLIDILKELCHIAECEYANPHSHRHGLLSRLLLQKEDLKTVSELAGHKNTSTTLNTYYHTTDVRKREVADRAALAPVPSNDEPAPLRLVIHDETA